MSQERDLDQTVTVARGDVTVEKSFEAEEFPVPAVSFRIESSDSEPIEVRLVDQIPEEFPMSAIGFHPDFESDNWSAYKDHRVVFERTLEPGEELRTVYGVRLDREEEAAAFLGEPTLEGIDDADENVEDILGEDRNQAVRDVLAGERDSLVEESEPDEDLDIGEPDTDAAEDQDHDVTEPEDEEDSIDLELEQPSAGADDDSSAEADGDSSAEVDGDSGAPAPRSAPNGTAAVTELGPDGVDAAPDQTDTVTDETANGGVGTAGPGGVAEALAAEIRADEIAEEDLEVLREELDLGVPRSVDVRIRRLQRTVSDLDAYTDALEEFIDEEGTAQELIESFRADVEALSATVADLESNVASTDAEITDLRSDVAEVDDRLDAVGEEIEEVQTDLADVDAGFDDLTAEVETVSQEVETTSEEVDAVSDEVDRVTDEIDRVTGEVEQMTTEIGDLTADVETLREDLEEDVDAVERELDERTDELESTLDEELDAVRTEIDRTVDDVLEETEANADRLDDLEADVSEFEQFRERLEQAFGGMGAVDDADEEN